MALSYDPEWQAFAQAMREPPVLPEDIEARVKGFNSMLIAMGALLPPTDPGIHTREADVNPDVRVRIYTPPGTSTNTPLPLVVFIHGGGWQAGNLDTEDHTCRTICAGVTGVVVSCDYRKAPSVKFPVPLDDAYAGYEWAIANAGSLGANPTRCVVLGGSAGGALAIAVAYRAVQRKRPIAGLVALQPMSLHPDAAPPEYKHLHRAYEENAAAAVVDAKSALEAWPLLGVLPPYEDPSWFPQSLGAGGFQGFPPTFIVNTDVECFRDDGGVLEAELKDAGVPVRRDVITGFPHYFWSFPLQEGGKMFRQKLVDGIKWLVEAR